MLVGYIFLSFLYNNCKSENIITLQHQSNQNLHTCVTDIVQRYLSDKGVLTFIDIKTDDEILEEVHSSMTTTIVSRQIERQSPFRHQGYLITVKTAAEFTEYFQKLLEEPTWNPTARFLIVINSLKEEDLKKVFDVLLKTHVINVLVVNGTDDAHLYTYNPYDNFACGKYYKDIISYGVCLQATNNLYPNKLVTGLRNCTLRANVPHRPPFSENPAKLPAGVPKSLGIEQHLFMELGKTEGFNVIYNYEYENKVYSTIGPTMKVKGTMSKLQNNITDVIFGSVPLTSSRSDAFESLYGHMDFCDDLRFVVKSASYVSTWKYVYWGFSPLVWWLVLLVFLSYSIIVILMLRAEDKVDVILNLLRALLSHSLRMPDRVSVKCILLLWVWFSYIIYSAYQASLVSIIGKPIKELQITNEFELIKYNLKPCIVPRFLDFIYSEVHITIPKNEACVNTVENLKKVSNSKHLYTLTKKIIYEYQKVDFYDEYGHSRILYFDKPYAKFIYGTFFYKGFPLTDKMRQNAIRLRESGLVHKMFLDRFYAKKMRYKYHEKRFKTKFIIPWLIYGIGCILGTIVFILELWLGGNKNMLSK
uniref:SFRICE041949.2 n=1 Tax=Spodoptera frugiperda TaxID=7108 RepID=A0A2H1VMI1_SPOFR